MKRIATLNSIDTYANTVDFLMKNFGDKEFTAKEYDEKRDHARNIFCFGTVKEYSPDGRCRCNWERMDINGDYHWEKNDIDEGDLIYRTREEAFTVPHSEDEEPITGKRYYYRVSPMISYAVLAQKKALAKQIKDEKMIYMLESRIHDLNKQLENNQRGLKKMIDFVKEYGE